MKTIKFRLEYSKNAKPSERYKLQTKILWMWRYETDLTNKLIFSTENSAIEYLYDLQVEKREHLQLIQYPTISILEENVNF